MNWNLVIKNAIEDQKKLLETAKNEVRGFTDEEQTKFDEFTNSIKNAKKMIEMEKQVQEDTPVTPAPAPTNTGAGVPAQSVQVTKNEPLFKNGIGSLLNAVATHKTTGVMDQRITNAAQGGNELVPADGGFLVGETMSKEIIKRVYDSAVIAGRCRRRPVSVGDRYVQNYIDETSRVTGSRKGGIQSYWIPEAGTITPSKPKLGQIDLKLGKLAGMYYATDELISDAAGLEAEINGWFGDDFAWMLDEAILNGTGAGQPSGILGSNAVVSVAKESGQSANTIVYENIIKMWARAWAKGRSNSVWLINQNIEPELFTMAQTVGTGGVPVYLPANGISGSPYSTLMGLPVLPVEQASTLGTKGDIMLVDLDSYLLIDKAGEGIKSAESIHVAFATDEKAFRFTYRVNGQPIWQNALTPAKGTATLSPFVTLNTRA
jgi:HK97 family phage major capsid protein